MLRILTAICLAAGAASSAAAAETSPVAENPNVRAVIGAADAWLGTRLARDGVVGASIAVVHDQEIVWTKGYGEANREKSLPATPETRYSLCSISKIFTSMAAMRERDSGKLDIDAPISRYLPSLERENSGIGSVTARSIMSHVSGLPREYALSYWTSREFPDPERAQSLLPSAPDVHPAYQTLQYSNLGMALLGRAIEASSGRSYADYLSGEILQPLGMDATTTDIPVELYGGELAVPYGARRTNWSRDAIPPYQLKALAPAAGFTSTALDLARFASWQFRLPENGESNVLNPSTLAEMYRVHWMTPDNPEETWGLGFIVRQHDDQTFIVHDGWCPGYRASLILRPQDKIAVITLANVDDLDPEAIGFDIYSLLAPAILEAADGEPVGRPQDFSYAEGRFGMERSAVDVLLYQVGDELRSLYPFQAEGVAGGVQRWRHLDGTRFEEILDGPGRPGIIEFELNDEGRAVQVTKDHQTLERLD